MFGLVSRRRAVALEAENRRLRMRLRVHEALTVDNARTVYRYERRLVRLCRAVAVARRDYAAQCRVADRLSDQLMCSMGYSDEGLKALGSAVRSARAEVQR
ncbi:hypothetical protein [Streptomyces sp. NPDC001774]